MLSVPSRSSGLDAEIRCTSVPGPAMIFAEKGSTVFQLHLKTRKVLGEFGDHRINLTFRDLVLRGRAVRGHPYFIMGDACHTCCFLDRTEHFPALGEMVACFHSTAECSSGVQPLGRDSCTYKGRSHKPRPRTEPRQLLCRRCNRRHSAPSSFISMCLMKPAFVRPLGLLS